MLKLYTLCCSDNCTVTHDCKKIHAREFSKIMNYNKMNSQLRMRIKTKRQEKMKRRQKKKTQCTGEEEVLQWQNKPDWLGRWSFQRLVEWEWQEVLRSSGWTFIRETKRVVFCNVYKGEEKNLLRFDEISKQMYSWNLSLRQHTIWIKHFWQVKVFLVYKSTVYLCT